MTRVNVKDSLDKEMAADARKMDETKEPLLKSPIQQKYRYWWLENFFDENLAFLYESMAK